MKYVWTSAQSLKAVFWNGNDGRKYGYKVCSATDYKSVYPKLPELEILGNAVVNCAP